MRNIQYKLKRYYNSTTEMPRFGSKHHRDSLTSWFACMCASILNAANLGFSVSFGVMMPALMKEFHEGRQQTVWIGSLAIALTFLLGPLASVLCKAITCRFTAIAGGLTCAVGLLLTSYSRSFGLMFFTVSFLYGLGASMIFTASFLITAKNFRRFQYLAVGIVSLGGSVGVLIFGPLLQFLIDRLGWRGTYRVTSVLFVLVCICAVSFGEPRSDFEDANATANENCTDESDKLTIPEDLITTKDVKRAESIYLNQVQNRKERSKLIDLSVFKVPRFTVVVTSLTLMCLGHYAPQLLLVKYCLEVGISADSASTLFIFIGLASSFSRVVTGRMCDISWINTIFVYQFGNLLVGLITICLLLIKDYTGMVVFAVVYGVGDGIFITTMNSLLMFTVDEKRRASALGLGNFLLSLGIAGGPPLAGFLADKFSCYRWSFMVAGILMQFAGILPFVLVWLDKEKQRHSAARNISEPAQIQCHFTSG